MFLKNDHKGSPQFNKKGSLLFSLQDPSVQHQKPLSPTPTSVQHTPRVNTKNPSVQYPDVFGFYKDLSFMTQILFSKGRLTFYLFQILCYKT